MYLVFPGLGYGAYLSVAVVDVSVDGVMIFMVDGVTRDMIVRSMMASICTVVIQLA